MNARGQAATEYLVVVGTLATALFAPLADGASVAQRLAEAIASAYRTFAVLVAMP